MAVMAVMAGYPLNLANGPGSTRIRYVVLEAFLQQKKSEIADT